MINDGKSIPVKFAVVNQHQQIWGSAAPTVEVKDINVETNVASFELAHGGKFSITVNNLLEGLHISVNNSEVVLSYHIQQLGTTQGLAHYVENRAVALASHPMTLPLLDAMRQAVRRVVNDTAQSRPSGLSPVVFEQPLTLRGITSDNFNGYITIHSYTLHENRTVELEISVGSDEANKLTQSAVEWRHEMTKWAVASLPTHEHQILLSIIKPRNTAYAADMPQPQATQADYHPRGDADIAQTDPEIPAHNESRHVATNRLSVAVDSNVLQVASYSVFDVPENPKVSRVEFYDTEGKLIAMGPLCRLSVSKRCSRIEAIIDIHGYAVSTARRKTLVKRLDEIGEHPLMNHLITAFHLDK